MKERQTSKIIIKDERTPGWFWITNKTLEVISEAIGITGIAVYSWLCYHRNYHTGLCHPSISTLAKRCRASRRTIIRTIRLLEEKKLIAIEHSSGEVNIYRLLDLRGTNSGKTTSISGDTGDIRILG